MLFRGVVENGFCMVTEGPIGDHSYILFYRWLRDVKRV